MEIGNWLVQLIQGGLGNLTAYLAAHVPLCMVYIDGTPSESSADEL